MMIQSQVWWPADNRRSSRHICRPRSNFRSLLEA
ncbi:hypothetical protein EJF18_70266 [Clavispora lusitaniae]|uniref:Uncharacterized protein n=1 Tax=Clavispora lusitaniae TaxID=36911 RepID=A0ACD0WSR9_CLALS|nr:hypothetical protein EJF14_70266 [Clavispora lusitaniae]QFZ35852.1 hypothetical protein EJF16_70266 [Clavispora lusitaniae]QFZ41534.1 hypothetical protein EJF15_70266 [Clavispora lusitaniae]QFZ47212.1 hypothetical protein EJF18_70266 [Clavispora lusitaniae]QFZ52889.1 hypothetical protein EJF17_70266 [Clavispora lusitaniae]